mmetsp:Transcript_63473/g.186215  ORF Transcript_63473/g.186215 Transcript_63473/m.186215 type:complete len:242 (-) Transcript_63473:65-790(-)
MLPEWNPLSDRSLVRTAPPALLLRVVLQRLQRRLLVGRVNLHRVVGPLAELLEARVEVLLVARVVAADVGQLVLDVALHELEGVGEHDGKLLGHVVRALLELLDLLVLVLDVLVLVADQLLELVVGDVQLLLLLGELRLERVDTVNQLLLQRLVLPRHVRRHSVGGDLLPLEVRLHLVHLGAHLHLAPRGLLGVGRLDLQLALERLDLRREEDPLLLDAQLDAGVAGASLLLPLLPHRPPR